MQPEPLTEPYVKLSLHTALVVQPSAETAGLPAAKRSSHCWLTLRYVSNDLAPSLEPAFTGRRHYYEPIRPGDAHRYV